MEPTAPIQQAPAEPIAPANDGALSLQIVSDIHVEFYMTRPFPLIPPRAKYLCLLGDIGVMAPRQLTRYRDFLQHHAGVFERVFVLLGNHEYYGSLVHDAFQRATAVCAAFPNVTLLQKSSLLLDGFRLLGTTLWSRVPKQHEAEVGRSLNDYHTISVLGDNGKARRLTVSDTNAWFQEECAWLETEINAARERGETVIVLTHHSPIKDGSHPMHDGSPINGAFCTDLEYMMGPPIAFWGFGHTHYAMDVTRRGTRVLTNAAGYPSERVDDYDPELVVEIKRLSAEQLQTDRLL